MWSFAGRLILDSTNDCDQLVINIQAGLCRRDDVMFIEVQLGTGKENALEKEIWGDMPIRVR